MAPALTNAQAQARIGDPCCPPAKKPLGCFQWEPIYMPGTIGEFFGTFFVTFFTGAALSILYYLSANRECCAGGRVEAALANGLAYYVSALVLRQFYGAHFNPVVTLAMLIMQRIKFLYALLLWAAQFAGAIVAGALLQFFFALFEPTLGTAVPTAGFSEGKAFFLEAIAVFFVVLYVLLKEKCGRINPASYGGAVAVVSFTLIQYTGASLNPARQLGQAIFSGVWTAHWVYWVGPFVAAAIAALVYLVAFFTMRDVIEEARTSKKRSSML